MYCELRAGRESLETLWRQGLSGHALVERHTQLVDDYLARCFAEQAEADGMALVALGGYGRRELFPYSDIDLMLLYGKWVDGKRLNRVAEGVFYPLWDAGLEVGHAVRNVKACMTDAAKDYFFQVAMLDARLVAGSTKLFEKLQNEFRRRYVEGNRLDFFKAMLVHRQERHRRFGRHSYLLEPHIKESQGGLRDIQAMLWTSEVVFGLRGLAAIEDAGLLSRAERGALEEAWDQLVRIRNRLHYISGRKNDQLYFEHQEEMAEAFGYRSDREMLGVERFMREVHGNMQTVVMTTELFFEHVDEVLGLAERGEKPDRQLEPGIELRDGRIHFTGMESLEAKPYLLMRLFWHMAKTGSPLHHRTRKTVTDHLYLVDDRLRASRRMAKTFLELLNEALDVQPLLATLLETGLLDAYLPEFANVRSLAQHDVYHVFTVDRHLLQALVELHGLRQGEEAGKFAGLASPRVLFLAALLHDIGKGQGRDHSECGAEQAATIGKRLGLSDFEVDDLRFVVQHHLFLSDVALRRDLEDEGLIRRCAEVVGGIDRLSMLYLLAIADAKATGPTVWNEWKAALLLELYFKIANLIEGPDQPRPDLEHGESWMREQLVEQLEPEKVQSVQVLPEEYVLSFTPEAVARHLALREQLRDRSALLETEEHQGFWSLLIVARDRTGLLAKICGTLALHNLTVLGAQIFTWDDGTAVDILDVQPWVDIDFADQNWQALDRDINLALGNRLGLDHRLVKKDFPRPATRKLGIRPAGRVRIDNQSSDSSTVIEVFADDRPRLLYDITRTPADFNLSISRAKIATKGDQMVDVFYVRDEFGAKIVEPALQEELRLSLLHAASLEEVK